MPRKAKLSNELIKEIAGAIDAGMDMKEVCEIYRISYSTARRIKNREGRYGKILAEVEITNDVTENANSEAEVANDVEEIEIDFNDLKPVQKVKVETEFNNQYVVVTLYEVIDSEESMTNKIRFDKKIKLGSHKVEPLKLNGKDYILSTIIGEII